MKEEREVVQEWIIRHLRNLKGERIIVPVPLPYNSDESLLICEVGIKIPYELIEERSASGELKDIIRKPNFRYINQERK